MLDILLITLMAILVIYHLAATYKAAFKIGYYETKLKNRGVDIDHVKNMSLLEMLKS